MNTVLPLSATCPAMEPGPMGTMKSPLRTAIASFWTLAGSSQRFLPPLRAMKIVPASAFVRSRLLRRMRSSRSRTDWFFCPSTNCRKSSTASEFTRLLLARLVHGVDTGPTSLTIAHLPPPARSSSRPYSQRERDDRSGALRYNPRGIGSLYYAPGPIGGE